MTGVHAFETPGSVSLQIQLPSGRVVVATADEPRTSVELVPLGRRGRDAVEEIEVRAERRGDGHVITIEQRDRFRWGPIQISWGGDVEVRVVCPPGSHLDFSGASADLRVEGDLGKVGARTASGDVELDRVRGSIQVKTASGDVSVGAIESGGTLATVSGQLDARGIEGAVTARTISGDVRLGTVRAPLTLSTTSGEVILESVEAGEVRIQTVSGDARIGVGRGTRVWIDAASVSGDLDSELGIGDEAPAAENDPERAAPVVPLHVKTVSGDVSIVRAATAFSA